MTILARVAALSRSCSIRLSLWQQVSFSPVADSLKVSHCGFKGGLAGRFHRLTRVQQLVQFHQVAWLLPAVRRHLSALRAAPVLGAQLHQYMFSGVMMRS